MNAPDPTMSMLLHCADVTRLRDAYVAGALDERTSRAIEAHAAICDECGGQLDAITRVSLDGYAPLPPVATRERTLAAVRRPRLMRHVPLWGGALAIAAAVTVFVAGPWRDGTPATSAAPVSVVAEAGERGQSPAEIAAARSASEFEALDAAARELQQALDAAPDDDELRDFLASIRARRAELAQRVKDAAS